MESYYNCHQNFALLFIASFILVSSSLLHFCTAQPESVDFEYQEGTGKGPKKWGEISKICDTGRMQSPIDLVDEKVEIVPDLGKLMRDYQPAPAVLKRGAHGVMVNWTGDAGKLNINGTAYDLIQCHWHYPSEHTINGSRYELEIQLVHTKADGGTAVIGIVYKYGRRDRFLSMLLDSILGDDEMVDLGTVNPGNINFGSRKYFRYNGSLTVPPCTEGVIWTISKKVRTVSREQVQALKDAVGGYEGTARPTQDLAGRSISLYGPTAD